jgi:hypothetical protein
VSTPVNNPDESAAPQFASPSDVQSDAATDAPPNETRKERRARKRAARPPRDRRWFLRILAWIVVGLGLMLVIFAVTPRKDAQIVEGDVISRSQMMGLASIPVLTFGGFLIWWSYGKVGEPLIACRNCLHVNKPRSTECAKCGKQLG